MKYVVAIGSDNKSTYIKTVLERPKKLEADEHYVELKEEPTVGRWVKEGSTVRPMTEAERDAELASLKLVADAKNNRQHRNMLLMESDWTQVPDSPLSNAKKTSWATYRTELRNLPSHSNWPDLEIKDWPSAPS